MRMKNIHREQENKAQILIGNVIRGNTTAVDNFIGNIILEQSNSSDDCQETSSSRISVVRTLDIIMEQSNSSEHSDRKCSPGGSDHSDKIVL